MSQEPKRVNARVDMQTVSYAYPTDLMLRLRDELADMGVRIEEEGGPEDEDGHIIEGFAPDGRRIVWAMVNSLGEHYLLRAYPGLLVESEEREEDA